MKVFSYSEMPNDIRDAVFEMYDYVGNNCYVRYYVNSTVEPSDLQIKIDKWLIEQGVDGGDAYTEGEDVLLDHSWQ